MLCKFIVIIIIKSNLIHFKVQLVSEFFWSEDFVIRSIYMKNIVTNETRTVTQFHFVSILALNLFNQQKLVLKRLKYEKNY